MNKRWGHYQEAGTFWLDDVERFDVCAPRPLTTSDITMVVHSRNWKLRHLIAVWLVDMDHLHFRAQKQRKLLVMKFEARSEAKIHGKHHVLQHTMVA